jgi:hypothetical protein
LYHEQCLKKLKYLHGGSILHNQEQKLD